MSTTTSDERRKTLEQRKAELAAFVKVAEKVEAGFVLNNEEFDVAGLSSAEIARQLIRATEMAEKIACGQYSTTEKIVAQLILNSLEAPTGVSK